MPDPSKRRDRAGRRAKRFLSPAEKYQAFVQVKTGLLDLIDEAVAEGWPATRACVVLELDERRARRWRSRGDLLDDGSPGRAVHGLLPAELDAIVELFDRFVDIDRSYRKL